MDNPVWGKLSTVDECIHQEDLVIMKIHDVVALTEDLTEHNLKRGQVGTIVEEWETGVFGVEFATPQGQAYAMVAVPVDQLMLLRWEPA